MLTQLNLIIILLRGAAVLLLSAAFYLPLDTHRIPKTLNISLSLGIILACRYLCSERNIWEREWETYQNWRLGVFQKQILPVAPLELEATLETPIIPKQLSDINTLTHALIIGETGSGKSTLAKQIAQQLPGKTEIIDPHCRVNDWGFPVIGSGRNYQEVAEVMEGHLLLLDHRFKQTQNGELVNIICDEYPAIVKQDSCKDIAARWFQSLAMESRKVNIRLILLTQGETGKSLNIEGQTELRQNFSIIRLGKFAIERAKRLKDERLIDWLNQQAKPALLNEDPLLIPNILVTTLVPHHHTTPHELHTTVESLERLYLKDSTPPHHTPHHHTIQQKCPQCGGVELKNHGKTSANKPRLKCGDCGKTFS